MNIAKILRKLFLKDTSGRLFFHIFHCFFTFTPLILNKLIYGINIVGILYSMSKNVDFVFSNPMKLEKHISTTNACTQAAICFFTAKYEILQLHPNGHSFFYREIRNLTVVPKRPFVFLQRNAKF